jgi:sugar phosphate isomerase/epimerase
VEQAAGIAGATGSDAVRVLADTYHMNIEEDDICAALAAVAPVLGAVHLSDSNRHQPGTGHVPFAAILATLRDIGFTGTLSVECRMRGELGAALPACGAHLRGLLTAEEW